MKKFLLSILVVVFLAATFPSHNPPAWYQIPMTRTDVEVQDMYFTDSETGFVVNRKNTLDSSFIIKTTNGGNNWTTVLTEQIFLTSINFPTKTVGYSVGSQTPGIIKKTTNAGDNWFTIALLSAYPLRDVKFVNKDTGWVCSDDGFDGGVFKTTNGGVNWQRQLNPNNYTSKLFFLNTDTGWAVTTLRRIYKTTNSGVNWNLIYTDLDIIRSFFFLNQNTGWFVGGDQDKPLAKTTDGGFNWHKYPDPGFFSTMLDIYLLKPNKGWIADAFEGIYSLKNDTLWGSQSSPSGNHGYTSIFMIDTLTGYAGGDIIIKTDDGGGVITGINSQGEEIVSDYKLYQNYPNPFNPTTKINYELPFDSKVSIKLFDMIGREVAQIVNAAQTAGYYTVQFNGANLASGVYFYNIIAEGGNASKFVTTKKMVLVK